MSVVEYPIKQPFSGAEDLRSSKGVLQGLREPWGNSHLVMLVVQRRYEEVVGYLLLGWSGAINVTCANGKQPQCF